MKTQTIYLPSPAEIAEAARKIRSGWSNEEKRQRQRLAKRRQAVLARAISGSLMRTQSAA